MTLQMHLVRALLIAIILGSAIAYFGDLFEWWSTGVFHRIWWPLIIFSWLASILFHRWVEKSKQLSTIDE